MSRSAPRGVLTYRTITKTLLATPGAAPMTELQNSSIMQGWFVGGWFWFSQH